MCGETPKDAVRESSPEVRWDGIMSATVEPVPRVVFFGMSGQFSRLPLEALIEAGFDVRALVVAAAGASAANAQSDAEPFTMLRLPPPARQQYRRGLPMLQQAPEPGMLSIARARDIPVLEVSRLGDERMLRALAAFEPDAICVACFPLRLPETVLRLPRLGCLNLHPSLLPRNRGPDPLFWTFRQGDETTGVTVHIMTAAMDTGPIVTQQAIPVPDGITEHELERRAALVGGRLLVRAVRGLMMGEIHPLPQDQTVATVFGFPEGDDFLVSPDRSARWAFNFIQGVIGRGEPMWIPTPDAVFRVVAALDYDVRAQQMSLWHTSGDELWLRCTPGVLHVRIERDEHDE